MTKEALIQAFYQVYGEGETPVTLFSPGRVNLIGEHIDYNGGSVFPCALTMGTYFAGRKRKDRKILCYSENFAKEGIVERSLDTLVNDPEKGFTNYLLGIIWTFIQKGFPVDSGMEIWLSGNIPYASGLSSSASVEVGMGLLLKTLSDCPVSMQDIALFSQYAENHFNQVNCGIMDQFIIAMGKKDCAVLLDTATLNYTYVPAVLHGVKLVIGCTNKKRGLKDSKYNERRQECETALFRLQDGADIRTLCDLSAKDFEELEVLLKEDDITAFGRLMDESHISLRDDYEVTGIELDTLTEEAWKAEGCLGSRMTGAGFGGCNVSLVKEEAVENFVTTVGRAYLQKIGYEASFYTVDIGDGAALL